MKAGLKIDAREFTAALREYQRATKKSEADILNRAGRNVALRSMQFTPKAVAAKIRAELRRNKLAIRILSARRKFKGMSISDRGHVVKKFISARVRSVRYVAIGWAKALGQLGGRKISVNPKSKAAKGYAKPATARNLATEIANNSKGADKVGVGALRDAINFVARDMRFYAERKLSLDAGKFSAKGAK
jgi:hypothetical protein